MSVSFITELLIILSAGLLAGFVCRLLRVSTLVGYLLVGTFLGRGMLAWVTEVEEAEYLARAGVMLLLFSIGLEFSLSELARLSRYFFIGGSVQMGLVLVPVVLLLALFETPLRASVLIGAALAFSSTVLVFKALAERGETATPHGRRAIGVLLFQDAALVPLLLLIPLLTGEAESAPGPKRYVLLASSAVLLVAAVLGLRAVVGRWFVPLLARLRSPELVVLFSLVVLGGVALGGYAAGLPPSIGAFAAGLVFSGNRLTAQVDALVLPFREVFSAVFFVSLGLLLDPHVLYADALLLPPALVGLVLLKWGAAAVGLRLTGLPWANALGTGIGLAHLGEFAFVLALDGTVAGVLEPVHYQRILLLALCSLILTPQLLALGLRWGAGAPARAEAEPTLGALRGGAEEAVVIGAGPVGRQVASRLEIVGMDACLIDLSPVNLHPFAQMGFRSVAGDATDGDVLRRARIEHARLVAVCVPDDQTAVRIVRTARELSPQCLILVRCRYLQTVAQAGQAGANAVVSEEQEASEALLRLLAQSEQQR